MTNIYVIAGEASGDFIASNIIRELKSKYVDLDHINNCSNLSFFGIGGPMMQEEGVNSLFPIGNINLMGFLEILPYMFKILDLIEQTVQDIINKKIDLLISVDSSGFNFRVAEKLRKLNVSIKMMHIVAPSVWAYKPGRAKKYAKIYDQLLVILPFEPPYFTKVGLKCTYIGHPFLAQKFYQNKQEKIALRAEFGIKPDTKIICITPGSRLGEIKRHMPIFKESLKLISKEYSDIEVIFVLNDLKHQDLIEEYLDDEYLALYDDYNFRFTDDKLKAFALSDVAIAKSGTNNLEIAASNTPLIIAYKINSLTFWLIKMMIKIRYACLINIVAKREIIPEFIQNNCQPEKIAKATLKLLVNSEAAEEQIKQAHDILLELGLHSKISPAKNAAGEIMNLINNLEK